MLLPRLLRPKGKNGERGQSLVEFTLLLPIFLLLMFAIVDFGMGFNAWITVTNSAREGARLGVVGAQGDPNCNSGSFNAKVECRVRNTAVLINEDTKMTVTVKCAPDPPGSCPSEHGNSVVVKVDYEYDLITPLSGIMGFLSGGSIGPTLTFSATGEMRQEGSVGQ